MKILHLALSCFYIDNYNFQENILPRIHKENGHQVKIIASTETYIEYNKLGYVAPRKYINSDGICVERIRYRNLGPIKLKSKLRIYKGLFKKIVDFKPDIIMHHGVPSFELFTLSKYKKLNKCVKIYLDSHEDYHNSARNWISLNILHKMYYKPIVKLNYKNYEKILCVSLESIDFIHSVYGIPNNNLELYPLGGIVIDDDLYFRTRLKYRKKYDVEDKLVFIHSGKMNKRKNTIQLLEIFSLIEDTNSVLLLAGVFSKDEELYAKNIIEKSTNIRYLGWLDRNELNNLMCATDVYLQPGSQSASLQNAICYRNIIISKNHPSYQPFVSGNGYLINDGSSLNNAIHSLIKADSTHIEKMKKQSLVIGKELLDYEMLAKRLLR